MSGGAVADDGLPTKCWGWILKEAAGILNELRAGENLSGTGWLAGKPMGLEDGSLVLLRPGGVGEGKTAGENLCVRLDLLREKALAGVEEGGDVLGLALTAIGSFLDCQRLWLAAEDKWWTGKRGRDQLLVKAATFPVRDMEGKVPQCDARDGDVKLLPLSQGIKPVGVLGIQGAGLDKSKVGFLSQHVASRLTSLILLRQLQERETVALTYDEVSGLYRPRAFRQRLVEALDGDSSVQLVCLRVGSLGLTRLGREWTGRERILAAVGATLRECLRRADAATCWDEGLFVFMLPGTGDEEAQTIVGRIMDHLAGKKLPGILRWGIASSAADGNEPDALLEMAEKRLGVWSTVKIGAGNVLN